MRWTNTFISRVSSNQNYLGCLLYFGIREQNQILINHRKSLYCFSKHSPLRSIHFCMRLNQLLKHFCHCDWGISKTCILNASSASSGVEKCWSLILFFMYEVIWCQVRTTRRTTHQIDVLSPQKCSCFLADVWELALSWWRVSRLRRLIFLISWKTTGK